MFPNVTIYDELSDHMSTLDAKGHLSDSVIGYLLQITYVHVQVLPLPKVHITVRVQENYLIALFGIIASHHTCSLASVYEDVHITQLGNIRTSRKQRILSTWTNIFVCAMVGNVR